MSAVLPEDSLRFRLMQRRIERAQRTIADGIGSRPYVAFSGGKDSLVALAIAASVRPGIEVVWSDDELEHACQPDYIRSTCDALGVRLRIVAGYARHADWFTPWRSEPYWREPLPEMEHINALTEVWAAAEGYTDAILGLRRDESMKRRIALGRRGKVYLPKDGVTRINPLSGWSTADVWALIAGWGLPVNPAYDRMTEVGVPREKQRVGPLPLSPGWILSLGWPEMYRQLTARYGNRW